MKNLILITFTFLSSFIIMGQDMYVDIETTNPSPGIGEKFKISYILKVKLTNGSASFSSGGIRVAKPNFTENFTVLQEGTERTSFGFGNMGGDMKVSKYSFILKANKKGALKIPPLTFLVNGEKIESGIFTVNIGKGSRKIQTADPNLFARIELNKRNVYKGEAIAVTYKVYTRYNGFAIEDYEMPMTNGLWKEEIKSGANGWKQTVQTVNGMRYNVITLKKEIITPQKSGDIKIEPISIEARVGRSFFNQGQAKSVRSNSPTIKVKPLPKPTPANFSNQVGSNYKVVVNYSTNKLKTNDPLDIKIEISGRGNINQLANPSLDLPQDFEAFDPEVKDRTKVGTSGISGKKTFNYLVIPRHRGTFELPPFEFTYFDVKAKKYKTITKEGTKIFVEQGENQGNVTSGGTTTAVNKNNVEILNTGIRHIKEKTTLYTKKDALYGKTIYWIGIFAPVLLVLGYYLFLVFIKNNKTDEHHYRKKNANKLANSRLKTATQFLEKNKTTEFYEELYKAIFNYISHKFNIPISKLTKESIQSELENHSITSEVSKSLIDVITECEMARFAPTTQTGAQQTLEKTTDIINKIERNVKK